MSNHKTRNRKKTLCKNCGRRTETKHDRCESCNAKK